MRESIETWKVLILIAEFFCFGGSLFTETGRTAQMVLTVLTCLFGIAYVLVI